MQRRNLKQVKRERLMIKKLDILKTKLLWSNELGRDWKIRARNDHMLRLQMWATIGYLKYNFQADDLW